MSVKSSSTADLIIEHLGGRETLEKLGARDFAADEGHLSFVLGHHNPKGIHSVTISREPDGRFRITCHGRLKSGSLTAPKLGTATIDIPENLASVFGQLTGIEILRHRHF